MSAKPGPSESAPVTAAMVRECAGIIREFGELPGPLAPTTRARPATGRTAVLPNTRVTEAQRAAYALKAQAAGKSLSDWIRDTLDAA